MDRKSIKYLISTIAAFLIFLAFTLIVAFADVSEIKGVRVGLSTMNAAYYKAVPFNNVLYKITSVTQFICVLGAMFFFVLGIVQWGKRKSLLKVDRNIAALGITYAVTIVFYVLFEIVAINFRPVILRNKAEASYPSSTTLLSIVFFFVIVILTSFIAGRIPVMDYGDTFLQYLAGNIYVYLFRLCLIAGSYLFVSYMLKKKISL